jgi:trimeric autotransporter adhesin
VNRSPSRGAFLVVVIAWFALSQAAQSAPKDNTALGSMALSKTTGTDNTALGFQALPSNTTGSFNSATGSQALFSNTTGLASTAVGFQALYSITNTGSLGFGSTAIGYQALRNSTVTGDDANGNTATGYQTLFSDTTGDGNTADGVQALYSNTTGQLNTASGRFALFTNSTGSENTAVGASALKGNTTGFGNTALGRTALFNNTTGNANIAIGRLALSSNQTGSANTAIGVATMFNDGNPASYNGSTAVGAGALYYNTTDFNIGLGVDALYNNASGSTNIGLGVAAGYKLANGGNNIYIGNFGVSAAESNTIRIGYVVGDTADGITVQPHTATFIAGVSGTAVSGAAVVVNADGQLGVAASSARFKTEIKSMDKASEAILSLKPATFRYNEKIDPKHTPQFGLVAEDVAKVNPALVVHDRNGDIYSVRYDAVNAMLLNEFLKEHQKVNKLEVELAAVNARLKEQDAKIDKVNAKVELTKPAPQMVNNSQ